MEPYWIYSILLLGLLLVRVLLNLVPPYLVKTLVDQVLTPQENYAWLKWFVLGLILVAAATMG